MKDGARKNHSASIRARLLAHARENEDDFQRVITRYGIERLLFRLSQTEAEGAYILKGAMLFATWPENAFRPTGDLDLLGNCNPDPAAIQNTFQEICRVDLPEDGIIFDPASVTVEAVREAEKYQGATLRLTGTLGTAVITVLVDIGFGDWVYPPPERQEYPSLLPDLPAPRVFMYPPETVVAEKFEALIRFAEANSRIKDFYDLWITSRTFPFEMSILVEAVLGTMHRRETAIPVEMPVGLTEVFALVANDRGYWTGFLRRTPPATQPPGFPQVLEELRQFFGPVIAVLATPEGARGRWDPDGGVWR